MKKLISLAVLMAFAGAAGSVTAAGNAAAGKNKSAVCAGCHGLDGNSAAPNFPKLAGLDAQYSAKQLADFKSGARKDPVMNAQAAALSARDIEDIASYYHSLRGELRIIRLQRLVR
jgi:cytochrome c553